MILLDIDNCIADDAWRIPRIDWKQADKFRRYNVYHQLAPFDRAANFRLHVGKESIVMTSRPVAYRAATEEWLKRIAGVQIKHMLMRNDSDFRSSLEVKRTQLQNLLQYYDVRLEQIEAAYDDRPEIVEMYQRSGVHGAMVISIHNVSAYPIEEHA